jgi:hypothetical protein
MLSIAFTKRYRRGLAENVRDWHKADIARTGCSALTVQLKKLA